MLQVTSDDTPGGDEARPHVPGDGNAPGTHDHPAVLVGQDHGPTPVETLREIVEQSRARSAVYDVITNGVPVSIEVDTP